MNQLASIDATPTDPLDPRLAPARRSLVWPAVRLIAAGLVLYRLLTGPAAAEPPRAAQTVQTHHSVAEGKGDDAAKTAPVDKQAPAALTPDEADKLGSDWVRLLHDDNGKLLGMQTAIIRYVPAKQADRRAASVEVDLIAAIHVADAAYYRELNRRFKQYDALLYELVAPDGTVVPLGRGTSNTNPLGALQNGMKNMLELDHQLEQIDYTQPNFVHADLSPDQIQQAMKDRGEGFVQMYFQMLGESMAAQSTMSAKGESLDMDIFAALFAKDRARRLKTALAKQLAEVESVLTGFGGENGSVLITERNKAALRVLQKQIEAGKRRLGIFYGAGHLTDMDKRLRHDFGLKPVEINWLTAWDLSDPP
jgi:hypothetical protein